jgi:hypothetical protein
LRVDAEPHEGVPAAAVDVEPPPRRIDRKAGGPADTLRGLADDGKPAVRRSTR